MPGMRLFGRRCALATDDFFLIGVFDSIVYLPWLGWIPVVYASFLKFRYQCDAEDSLFLLDISLPSLCVLFLVNWLLSALLVIFSVRGTISKPEPRKHVVTLVYIKLIIFVVDAAWAILGTIILIRDSFCDIIGVEPAIKVCTAFIWAATLARLLMMIVFYDWNFSKNTKQRIPKQYFTSPVRKGTFKRWKIRLQTLFLWCTTPSEARKQALKTASEMLALLSCDLDLVASDVIAGLHLYRQKCLIKWKSEKAALRDAPPISNTVGEKMEEFPPDFLKPWMNLQLASRFMNIGLGAFGWPWFIYRNIACGFCLLLKRLTCCFPLRTRSRIVFGDNLCGCHLGGLEAISNLPYSDLVHVSWVDRVFEVPFFVCFDHSTSSVVVTARGTFSMNDVLTDCAAGFEPMDDDPSLPDGTLCHAGMLNAARQVKAKLEEEGILMEAFKEQPEYHLVITGHSLGASVASILTILYRNQYPDIRCYAFAPAPSINEVALPITKDIIFSVIYGNDTVCYLNYENVKNMIIQMVKCLEECDIPKYKVFTSSGKYFETLWHKENSCSIEMDSKQDVIDKVSGDTCHKNGNSLNVNIIHDVPCVTETVYVAGTILHIRKIEGVYKLKVSSAEEYKPLLFRPKSIINHFPQYVQFCLNDLGKSRVLKASLLPRPSR